jgi:hypothetical protein
MTRMVTIIATRSEWLRDSIIENNHYFADGSSVMDICWVISSFTGAHTHFDIGQSISECLHESSAPRTEHELVVAMFLWWRTSPVGSDCWASRHINNLSLEGT